MRLNAVFWLMSVVLAAPVWAAGTTPNHSVCPEGTQAKSLQENAGSFHWCEDEKGRKHGPSVSWYQTDLYLMEKGSYTHGEKTGEWIECDRFERCHTTDHSAEN